MEFRRVFLILAFGCQLSAVSGFSADIKQPNVAGAFYPADPQELSRTLDGFLAAAHPESLPGNIFALISPHAGYSFSGPTAAFGYKLIQGKPYKTVIVLSPSHQYGFSGVSVYPEGAFRTPLGDVAIDNEFIRKFMFKSDKISFDIHAFEKEHALEVQLPFLQKVLSGFKIVPVVMGDCDFEVCQQFATLLKDAIGSRTDVLVVASSDMYHGYDYDEADIVDALTLSYVTKMDAQGLYQGLREGKLQFCGAWPVVTTLLLAQQMGHTTTKVLSHTNSAIATGRKEKGVWTVGYSSCAIDSSTSLTINPERPVVSDVKPKQGIDNPAQPSEESSRQEKGAPAMLSKEQRKKLLGIARASIETYLTTGKKLAVKEDDSLLQKNMGAFVTLHEHGQLRGCIGSLIGNQSLYLMVRDMAVESAVDDPRFSKVDISELKDIEIEISALTPLERIDSADKINLGTHGVLVRQGYHSGVFLPQVATETGWTKEEFLSQLCAQKAGLPPDAWKDSATELYVFTAEVFSEHSY